jgi:alpha-D-xyloside xylohydrolase
MISKNIKILLIFFFLVPTVWAQKFEKTELGIRTIIRTVNVELQFYSPSVVRVLKSPAGTTFEKNSLSVIKKPETVPFSIAESGNILTLSTTNLKAQLNAQTGKVEFFSPDGKQLLTEKDFGVQFTSTKDANKDSYTVRQAFLLDEDEAIYGLGQQQKGKMNQRGQKIFLRNENMRICIPFFQSVKGYGLFWDNYSPTTFVDNLQETSFESEVGDCADYYFMYGGNADGVVACMRDLTGQAPMFPYWTYGYWQSKERYKSQDEIVGVVKKYRELGVPLDGIIQDWQYWGDNDHWNAMEFLNPAFPEPKKMIDDVHNMNAHIIISCWESFGPKTKEFEIMEKKGMLLNFKTWPPTNSNDWPQPADAKPSGVKPYDVYNPEARDIYWDFMNRGIFSLGMDGWWLDSTEPDHLEIKDEDFDNQTYLGSFRKVHNAYPLMAVGGVSDHQRQASADKRVFILTRSAFAGQQRYGANSWSGDVVSDWKVLRNQISGGLNFSLCGLPYWNGDIGGFFPSNYPGGVKNVAYRELYVRWLQFGAFTPMMRSHGTDTPREIWNFGEEGSWEYNSIEKFINLRYRLLPYIYSTSWDVTANSSSMMRALMMDFASDKKVLDINNEYMFGKSILVSPVTEPLYTVNKKEGSTSDFSVVKNSKTYLPAGAEWYDFWSGKKFTGGQEVERPAPMDIMPLYIKAGSVLPLGPQVQYANQKQDPTEIRIYPGANGEFTLYDDEKDNYNYEKGQYATIDLKWDDAAKTLIISDQQGEFPGMLKNRIFNVVVVSEKAGVGLNPAEKMKPVKYSGKKLILQLK